MSHKCIGDDTKAAARQSPNCIKKTKKYNMARNEFQYGIRNSYTLQCGTVMTLISSGDCTLQCDTWLLESWQLIHQVAAPCNATRSSGMTYHWIRPNVRHIGVLLLVSISTISQQSTCHSAPVCKIFIKISHLCHLGFRGSSKLLSFWWHTDKQTDRRTNGQARRIKPLSLLRAAA